MVMVSGAIGLHKKGGRSPPPKRGRLGGGRCAAAPYKHRLAHDPGRRSRSGRAFRCVGVLGQRPKRVLVPFTRVKGTPRRRAVLTWLYKRLSPPSGVNRPYHAPAVAVQTKFSKNPAPPKVITGYVTTAPQQPPVNHPTPQISANRSPTAAGRFDCVETHGRSPCRRLRRRACGSPTTLIFPTKSCPVISTI